MVNKDVALEYIASAAGVGVADVNRIVVVEYWKNMVSFSIFGGDDLYARFLRGAEVEEIEGDGDIGTSRLSVKLPVRNSVESFAPDMVDFCIEGTYALRFRRNHGNEFKFENS